MATAESVASIVPCADIAKGPSYVAWRLLQQACCTEEQVDAIALVAQCMQRQWTNRTDVAQFMLPPVSIKDNCRILFTGGGGCGKTYIINNVLRPLVETFYGRDSFVAQCSSNAGARLLKGRTIHASTGLSPASDLTIRGLQPTGIRRQKLEATLPKAAAVCADELSQASGQMIHADALSFTYGRAAKHNLDVEKYMQQQQLFGCLPIVVLSGDFYQLPPVPASASVLFPGIALEHRQGRAIVQSMQHVMEFKAMKRFDDDKLLEILRCMRTPGGARISDSAWQALQQTQLVDADSNLILQTAHFQEVSYSWHTVALAQQIRTLLASRAAKKTLYYVQAIDRPAHALPADLHSEMLKTPSMSETSKLMGLLPKFCC